MFRKIQLFLLRRGFGFVERYIIQFGFHTCIKKLMLWTHAKIRVVGINADLEKKLEEGSIVVVANHPTSASVVALIAALPTRKDIFLFIGSKFYGHATAIDRHLIPAYINNRCQPKNAPYPDTLPLVEERRRNIISITQAAEVVNNGGIVLIFPGYPEEEGSKWYNGVGFLIRQITNPKAYIAPIFIQEATFLGYLRLIPLVGFLFPPITFYLSPLIQVTEIHKLDPKHITKNLEEQFNKFVSSVVS